MSNSEGYRVGLETTSFGFWSLFDFKRELRRVALYHLPNARLKLVEEVEPRIVANCRTKSFNGTEAESKQG
jgi:hypothetical protein